MDENEERIRMGKLIVALECIYRSLLWNVSTDGGLQTSEHTTYKRYNDPARELRLLVIEPLERKPKMICVSTIDATPMDSAATLRSTLYAKCFNGFQSYQFGWYGQRTKLLDPMVEGNRLIYHAAFVDLQKPIPLNQYYYRLIIPIS